VKRYLGLWFGFLGAPLAWSVQELASYAMMAHVCKPRGEALIPAEGAVVRGIALAVTAACLIIALFALRHAARDVGQTTPEWRSSWEEAALVSDRTDAWRYLSFSGIIMGAIFACLIVYNLLALLLEPACR
jgi:hypothetical protein